MKLNHKIKYIFIISMAVISLGFTANDYYKINKSFDIFGALFREVAANYVLEIDPEILIKSGIEGMLATLDPYTEFYDDANEDDLELLTNGTYTGFGFTVANIDSLLTIISLREGNSAFANKLRVGDKIYSIDSTIVLHMDIDNLKKYTRGKAGSKAIVKILRDGIKDTLSFTLSRESINLPNVTYSGFMKNNIAYIKVERFSKNTALDVRLAINALRNQNKLNGLVIDLRDNPGGLLAAAVSLCEIFVPKGSLIVSTKGNSPNFNNEYRSMMDPSEPDLPLAVLINESSASASEIVAGAIQDLDRGVVIGRRSFGKGLVQSIIDLPHKTSLKITTSKYYTPSGRCIQKIKYGDLYSKKEIKENTDTTIFYTKNGRKVFELTGIFPDTLVEYQKFSDFTKDIANRNIIFSFANEYASQFSELPSNFIVNDKIYSKFEEFYKLKSNNKKSYIINDFTNLKKKLSDNNFSQKIDKMMNDLEKNISLEEISKLKSYKSEISKLIDIEVHRRFLPDSKVIEYTLKDDPFALAAVDLLGGVKYNLILSNSNSNKVNGKN